MRDNGTFSVSREDLPAEFTPETVRRMGLREIGLLNRPGNGVLTPDEQEQFEAALQEVMQDVADRLAQSLRIPTFALPKYDEQARAATRVFRDRLRRQAEVAEHLSRRTNWDAARLKLEASEAAPGESAQEDLLPEPETVAELDEGLQASAAIVSALNTLVDLQHKQHLSETRMLFFGLIVSAAVIVAGVAPVVEANSGDRQSILRWTAVVCALGAAAYLAVRWWQKRHRG